MDEGVLVWHKCHVLRMTMKRFTRIQLMHRIDRADILWSVNLILKNVRAIQS